MHVVCITCSSGNNVDSSCMHFCRLQLRDKWIDLGCLSANFMVQLFLCYQSCRRAALLTKLQKSCVTSRLPYMPLLHSCMHKQAMHGVHDACLRLHCLVCIMASMRCRLRCNCSCALSSTHTCKCSSLVLQPGCDTGRGG